MTKKSKVNPRTLQIKDLALKPGIQPRDGLNQAKVEEYAQVLIDGGILPALDVFWDGKENLLASGFTRHQAHIVAKKSKVLCNVHEGSYSDAWIFARGANKHGENLTNDEKRRVVREILENPLTRDWSNNRIALHVGVSDTFVGGIRREMEPPTSNVGSEQAQNTRIDRNGRTVNVARIGAKNPPSNSGYDIEEPPASTSNVGSEQAQTPPFFFLGDEVSGPDVDNNLVAGIVDEFLPRSADGREQVKVIGDHGAAVCIAADMIVSTGEVLPHSIESLAPGELIAFEEEGTPGSARFIRFSGQTIVAEDVHFAGQVYELNPSAHAVRRWTPADREFALQMLAAMTSEHSESEEAPPALNGYHSAPQVIQQDLELRPSPESKTLDDKILDSPLYQALSLFPHGGQLFLNQARIQATNMSLIRAAQAVRKAIRYTSGPITDRIIALAQVSGWEYWEGCPTCKGSTRIGPNADPCTTCKGGFVILPGTGVNADVIRNRAEEIRNQG